MDFFVYNNSISNIQLWIYNIFLIIYFIRLLNKYRKNDIAKFVIYLFTIGIFTDIGRLIGFENGGIHFYIFTSLGIGIYLLNKYKFKSKIGIAIFFILYVLYFIFVSAIIHKDNIPLVTAQILRYIIPVVVFFVVDSYLNATKGRGVFVLHKVMNDLILAQIIFCVIKLCILQAAQEGLVGSLTGRDGGGAGTSFPLLSLLWLAYVTKMKFSKKFLLYTLGLLFIGFMTGKRAVWLLFPIEFAILFLYYRTKSIVQLIRYLIPAFFLICFFFYFGLRLSPTLNPDNRVWGRFDLEFAYDYTMKYSGGTETTSGKRTVEEGDGRLGSALLLGNDIIDVRNYDQTTLFGMGNEKLKHYDRDAYFDKDANFGVSYRGGITAIVMMYFISGLLGVLLFLSYLMQIVFISTRDKIKWIVFVVIMFDFIFYNGQILNNVPMQSMLFVIILTMGVKGKLINRKKLETM